MKFLTQLLWNQTQLSNIKEVTEENLAPVAEEKTTDKPKTSEEKPETPNSETKKEETKKDTPEEKK